MKAAVYLEYGPPDVLGLEEIQKPTAGDDEVLVRVHAASVNSWDWDLLRGAPLLIRMRFGLLKPRHKILGADIAGRVEAVGMNVTRFQPDDEVFGDLCDCGWGGFAEYACAREDALALKPANTTFEEAAAVPQAAIMAPQGIRDYGHTQPGHKVLINGAGGGVGAFAVQIAKLFGAEVTGVDSTSKLDMMRSIGADHVIDYTQDDFTQRDERYDLILDIPGNHSLSDCRHALTPEGTYVLIGHDNYGNGMHRWVGLLPRMFKLMAMSPFVSQLPDVRFSMPDKKDSMALLKELLEAGKLTPYIDKTYPLSEVPEAIRYLQEGHAKGKVVITV